VVVDRKPCARAVRLVHRPDTRTVDVPEQPGAFEEIGGLRHSAGEVDADGERGARGFRGIEGDDQFVVVLRERERPIVAGDAGDVRSSCVERDLIGGVDESPGHRDPAGERHVGGVVLQFHGVLLDVDVGRAEAGIAAVAR